MAEISVTIKELLDYRRDTNKDIYLTYNNDGTVSLFVQATENILMKTSSDVQHPLVKQIAPYCNKSLGYRDKRLTSNNWLSTDTWETSGVAMWKGYPDTNYKLLITSIQVRFPRSIKITDTNRLYFKVHKFYAPMGAVIPVINLEYSSVRDLAKKSNNPLYSSPYAIANLSTEELIEMEFVYADRNNPMKGSPIVLSSSLGEFIEIGLTGNTPLQDTNDVAYTNDNESWCVINGKQILDI